MTEYALYTSDLIMDDNIIIKAWKLYPITDNTFITEGGIQLPVYPADHVTMRIPDEFLRGDDQ